MSIKSEYFGDYKDEKTFASSSFLDNDCVVFEKQKLLKGIPSRNKRKSSKRRKQGV